MTEDLMNKENETGTFLHLGNRRIQGGTNEAAASAGPCQCEQRILACLHIQFTIVDLHNAFKYPKCVLIAMQNEGAPAVRWCR